MSDDKDIELVKLVYRVEEQGENYVTLALLIAVPVSIALALFFFPPPEDSEPLTFSSILFFSFIAAVIIAGFVDALLAIRASMKSYIEVEADHFRYCLPTYQGLFPLVFLRTGTVQFSDIEKVDERLELWSRFGFKRYARVDSVLLRTGERLNLGFRVLESLRYVPQFEADVPAYVIAARAEVPFVEHDQVANEAFFWISPSGSPPWD